MNITKTQGKQIKEVVSNLEKEEQKKAFLMALLGYSPTQFKSEKEKTK